MTHLSLFEVASRLLPRSDREAVLGDLVEADASPRQILFEVLGLVARRQIAPWKTWQPWLAALGIALPASLLLMGASVSVIATFQRTPWPIIAENEAPLNLMALIFLLIAWSWTAGFVVASLSRRTLWTSSVACLVPCLFCLARFRTESLSRFSLFLFILPVVLGVCQGIRNTRISLSFAAVLAVAVTMLTILERSGDFCWLTAALLWPSWYIVATASGHVTKLENRETP